MNTPIHDFLTKYSESAPLRCHMPGDKGLKESLDITEIKGADSLYEAKGIIGESEENAARLYGSGAVCYSCGGSTLSINTMLCMARLLTRKDTIVAGRYSHRSLIDSCIMLGLKVKWVYPEKYLSADISPSEIERAIDENTAAVFINSIDYYGGTADIKSIGEICRKKGILLLVDNAHGAYQIFTETHPITLGADMCADSAHKTMPCITGTALLHLKNKEHKPLAKEAMALFGSSSPSYLMLDSLDLCNRFIAEEKETAEERLRAISSLKERLSLKGIRVEDSDEMRITIDANRQGYSGYDFAEELRKSGVECEMSDDRYVVLLFSVVQPMEDFDKLFEALTGMRKKLAIVPKEREIIKPRSVIAPRKAFFSITETVKTGAALGKVCAGVTCPCPPCVPVIMPGEVITTEVINALKGYGVEEIRVVM